MVLLRLMVEIKGEENGEKVLFVSLISKGDRTCVEPDCPGRRLTEGQVCACETGEGLKLESQPTKGIEGKPRVQSRWLSTSVQSCWASEDAGAECASIHGHTPSTGQWIAVDQY